MTQPIDDPTSYWNSTVKRLTDASKKCEENCVSTRCPAQGHIPNTILQECAAAAFAATESYYNGYTLADLDEQPCHIRLRVVKDVKAVLLGNRTPAQLHQAWADRKYEAVGKKWGKLKDTAPSAAKLFIDLSKEDQNGYWLFVDTVRKTYEASKATQPALDKEYGLLAAAIKAKTVCLEQNNPGQWVVTFAFMSLEDAQRLFTLSAK